MTRNQNILRHYKNGLSAVDIGLKYKITARQVWRILSVNSAVKHGNGKSKENQLDNMRMYVMECFRRLGKNLEQCELCGVTDKKLDIHHTKYEGATVYDLQLVCRKCNTSHLTKYLV